MSGTEWGRQVTGMRELEGGHRTRSPGRSVQGTEGAGTESGSPEMSVGRQHLDTACRVPCFCGLAAAALADLGQAGSDRCAQLPVVMTTPASTFLRACGEEKLSVRSPNLPRTRRETASANTWARNRARVRLRALGRAAAWCHTGRPALGTLTDRPRSRDHIGEADVPVHTHVCHMCPHAFSPKHPMGTQTPQDHVRL